ncbi:MAG: HAMP domain-containing histidine kinase [Myxococcales bacterium]|nr:HAMP domain-containing histidine kinase [Myxococcales bacterium]MCB9526436.1 HAMP domain-containing histidine kinase [Myxococcales bacterium]
MKLTLRLTLTITLLLAVVLSALGILSVQREAGILASDVERDAKLIALSLAHTSADPASLAAVDRFLRDDQQGELRVWLRPQATDVGEALSPEARARLAAGEVVSVERTVAGQAWVHALVHHTRGAGVVEVAESLELRDAFVRRAMWSSGLTLLLALAISGVVTLNLGRRLVGQRIDELVAHAAELGQGNLTHRANVAGEDELSALGHALNQLGAELAANRAKLQAAADAQLRSQREAEHADRLRMVGQLAAGVAHEVGTPLAIIAGRAQLVERRAGAESPMARHAGIIRAQADQITELVGRLLEHARPSLGDRVEVELGRLVAEAIKLLRPMAQRVRVVLEVACTAAVVRADPAALQQVVRNLVMNAVQATPAGGRVRITVAPAGAVVALTVDDTGPGVPPDSRERLFEPFFTSKAPGEGTGLGLSIVAGIVEDHAGRIEVGDSALGGARFTVLLPAANPEECHES